MSASVARTRSMKGEVELGSAADQTPSDSDPLLQNPAHSPPESSTEIKDEEDVESGSIPCCRICLESDAEPGEPLLIVIVCYLFFLMNCLNFSSIGCSNCLRITKFVFYVKIQLFYMYFLCYM